jgi:hypothetical protein
MRYKLSAIVAGGLASVGYAVMAHTGTLALTINHVVQLWPVSRF